MPTKVDAGPMNTNADANGTTFGQILNKAALVEAGQPKLSVESILALEAIQNESPQLANKYFRNQMTKKYLMDYVDGTFRMSSFPNSNIIRYNYN